MPLPVSPSAQRFRLLLLALPVLVLIVVGWVHEPPPLFDDTCVVREDGLAICAASDMTRTTRLGRSSNTHPRYDLRNGNTETLRWQVARNETLAFQLLLRRQDRFAADTVRIELADSPIRSSLYAAHYHAIDNAGYSWGPPTQVLPLPRVVSRCADTGPADLWGNRHQAF